MNPAEEELLDDLIACLEDDPNYDLEVRLAANPKLEGVVRAKLEALARQGLVRLPGERGRSLARIGERFDLSREVLSQRAPADAPPGGEVLDQRFELLEELGQGGMGAVLRAWDRDLGREVAIKITRPPEESGDEWVRRFTAEARIHGQLEHPGIAPLHELGMTEDGRLWFAMKLIRGHDLREVIRDLEAGEPRTQREFSLERRLEIVQRLGEALAYAHARGILHRDLKPANVLLGSFGEVQLMDWGLARAGGVADSRSALDVLHGESEERTATGQVFGTPSYMAPEQARADEESVNVRTDVFGLGALLYHLLAGVPPYRGADLEEVLERARLGQRNDPDLVNSPWPLSRELRAICARALEPDPAKRYATVTELVEDLRAFAAGRPGRAWRDSALTRAVKWVQHRPALGGALGAAMLILVVASAFSWTKVQAANRERVERELVERQDQRRLLIDELRPIAMRLEPWNEVGIDVKRQVKEFLQVLERYDVALSAPSKGIDLTALLHKDDEELRNLLWILNRISIDCVESGLVVAQLEPGPKRDAAEAAWRPHAAPPALWNKEPAEVLRFWQDLKTCTRSLEFNAWRRKLFETWVRAAEGTPLELKTLIGELVDALETDTAGLSGKDLEWAGQIAKTAGLDGWLEIFEAALLKNPGLYWANLLVGNWHLEAGSQSLDAASQAMPYYMRAQGAEPFAPQLYTSLVVMYRDLDPEMALHIGRVGVQRFPTNYRILKNLGLAEWDLAWRSRPKGQEAPLQDICRRSAEHLGLAHRYDPMKFDTRWIYARSLDFAGDPRGLEILEEMAAEDSDDASFWQTLAIARGRADPPDPWGRIQANCRALVVDPDLGSVRAELVKELNSRGFPERALALAQAGIERGWTPPESPPLDQLVRMTLLVGGFVEPTSTADLMNVTNYALIHDENLRAAALLERRGEDKVALESDGESAEAPDPGLILMIAELYARLAQGVGVQHEPRTVWLEAGDPDLELTSELIGTDGFERKDPRLRRAIEIDAAARSRWRDKAHRVLLGHLRRVHAQAGPSALRSACLSLGERLYFRPLLPRTPEAFDEWTADLDTEFLLELGTVWEELGWLE